MENNKAKAPGWGMIILILIGVGIVTGLVLGLLKQFFGLSSTVAGGGIGAAIGITAAFLLTKRQSAGQQNKN